MNFNGYQFRDQYNTLLSVVNWVDNDFKRGQDFNMFNEMIGDKKNNKKQISGLSEFKNIIKSTKYYRTFIRNHKEYQDDLEGLKYCENKDWVHASFTDEEIASI